MTNGITLCKMHHAAYDRNILGIKPPGYRVQVNADVLEEVDGPMLCHGIQDFHGRELMVLPQCRSEQPDRELLAALFETFLRAG
ncbi:hypothetical protein [Nocardioides sp.]|uniref:hypothetical protein n=1 Tax=Nocardioides sp. TaxID=35761 RepID=UPI003511BC76